ncbi:hypothetical protein [Streptomyces sp. NPDC051000]|uniref:hypothetical protein n=1 Tax=Streptomyces sp. NPDC051000 TaxID=3155520 RepID=UPI0033E18C8B
MIAPYAAQFFFLSAAAAAPPILVRDWPRIFAGACLVVGMGLLAWAVIGTVIGMFLFIPTALLLLVAAFSNAGVGPGTWLVVVAPIAAVAAVTTFFLRPPSPESGPPPSYHATLDSPGRAHDRDFNRGKERLREFGATSISVAEGPSGRLELVVGTTEIFAAGQTHDRLKEQILRLFGVLELCLGTYDTCE